MAATDVESDVHAAAFDRLRLVRRRFCGAGCDWVLDPELWPLPTLNATSAVAAFS